jgi:hypothetical protein
MTNEPSDSRRTRIDAEKPVEDAKELPAPPVHGSPGMRVRTGIKGGPGPPGSAGGDT